MRPSTRPKPLKRWTQTWRLNKLTKFVYVSVKKSETETETETERSVRASKGERERERERERGWERQAVPAPMTICFSRTSSPKSAKSREITKWTGSLSLSLSLCDSLHFFAPILIFFFIYLIFFIFWYFGLDIGFDWKKISVSFLFCVFS